MHTYLWRHGSVNPTAMLVEVACDDPDAEVRGHALEVLAVRSAFADRRDRAFPQVCEAVAAGLASEFGVVRFWAAYAVAQLVLKEHRQAVSELLGDATVVFAGRTVGDEARLALACLDSGV